MGKMPPPPPVEDLHLHPSTKQLELLPSIVKAPSTQQLVYETTMDSSSSGFFVSGQKVQNINTRNLARIIQPQC
jgi:hypothetical protein